LLQKTQFDSRARAGCRRTETRRIPRLQRHPAVDQRGGEERKPGSQLSERVLPFCSEFHNVLPSGFTLQGRATPPRSDVAGKLFVRGENNPLTKRSENASRLIKQRRRKLRDQSANY
jgi:hypothetical protein